MTMSPAAALLAALCALSPACRERRSDPEADAPPVDAGSDAPTMSDAGGAGVSGEGGSGLRGTGGAGQKPLALGCGANNECASGFCVDGVCCENACDGQCSVCNAAGNVGYCTAQIFGDDTTSAETCTGAHTCSIAIPSLSLVACRLKTLQACRTNSDCASLLCETFYVDHDGDGYGETGTALKLCEVDGAAPPVGYARQGGDCCDNDANAFPGQAKYFGRQDACGSWDYSCDGKVSSQDGWPIQSCGQSIQQGDSSEYNQVYCH